MIRFWDVCFFNNLDVVFRKKKSKFYRIADAFHTLAIRKNAFKGMLGGLEHIRYINNAGDLYILGRKFKLWNALHNQRIESRFDFKARDGLIHFNNLLSKRMLHHWLFAFEEQRRLNKSDEFYMKLVKRRVFIFLKAYAGSRRMKMALSTAAATVYERKLVNRIWNCFKNLHSKHSRLADSFNEVRALVDTRLVYSVLHTLKSVCNRYFEIKTNLVCCI